MCDLGAAVPETEENQKVADKDDMEDETSVQKDSTSPATSAPSPEEQQTPSVQSSSPSSSRKRPRQTNGGGGNDNNSGRGRRQKMPRKKDRERVVDLQGTASCPFPEQRGHTGFLTFARKPLQQQQQQVVEKITK